VAIRISTLIARVSALLLCISVIGEATAERTVARMGELRASVSDQNWCGPIVHVEVEAPPGSQLNASSRELQLLTGGVRQILTLECPSVQELQLTGRVGGQIEGVWRNHSDGQLVAMAPPSTFGNPAKQASGPASRAQVAEAQTLLSGLGYQPGPADGLMGQRTYTAMATFLRDRQLPHSDAVNSVLLTQLRLARCGNPASCDPSGSAMAPAQVPGAYSSNMQAATGMATFEASSIPTLSYPTSTAPSLPAASPDTLVWSFQQTNVQGHQIGSMDLHQHGSLLITARCVATPGADPLPGIDPRTGVLTVSLSPSITGPQSQEERSIDLATSSRTIMNWPLTFDDGMNAYTLRTILTREVQDSFERGTDFHINSLQTGRFNAPIPQDVGRALVAACAGRGIDTSATPVFSCDNVSHVTEHTICAVPELAAMDQRLNAAYDTAPDNLRASQSVWLEARNACRTDVHCINEAIAARIEMLSGKQLVAINTTGTVETATGLPAFGTIGQVPVPAADSLNGNDAVLDRFLLWAIGQEPDLATARAIHQRLRHFDFPPGLPEVSPRELDPTPWQARLEAAAAIYEDQPPVNAILELPLTMRRDHNNPDGPLEVHGTNRIGDTAAITQIILRDTGFSGTSTGLILHLDEPFFLPAPEEFTPIPDAMIGSQKGRILGRVEVTLSDHRPDISGTYYRGGTARAEVHSVSLVYRPVIRDNASRRDGPNQVLHVWTDQTPQKSEVTRPSTAREISGFFGGGVSDGRYILNALNLPEAFGESLPSQLRSSSARDGIILNMNLATLLNAQPDRTLAPDLAEQVIRSLLTERERADLLPLNIAMTIPNDTPTELELREALRVNDAAIRQRVRDRSPALPLAMRFVGSGSLGEYDFDSGGFPLRISSSSTPWFPEDRNGRTMTSHLPDFIAVDPEDAQNLIDRLSGANSRGNRMFTLVVDYDLIALSARPGRSGPITLQEVASVQPAYSSISIGLHAADDPTVPFHVIPVPEGFEDKPSDQGDGSQALAVGALPNEVFLTTGKSLLGAIAKLDEGGEIIEEAILHTRAVSPSPSSTYEDRKAAFREELRQSARDSYWIGASFDFSPYDADLGGLPLKGLHFQSISHGEDFDGIQAPPVAAAAPEDYAVLRVPEDAAAAIADAVGRKRTAQVYIKVEPVGTIYDRNEGSMLMVSAPREVIFEKTNSFSPPRRADIRVALGAPERIGVRPDDVTTELDVPEALMLDHEGINLLALSQAPDLFDETMFRRMLVDRMLKERAAASGEFGTETSIETGAGSEIATVDWGRFFVNPDQPLRADAMEAILPAFKEWMLARAEALPDTVLLPIGGQPHPMSGCRGLSLTNRAQIKMNEPFLQANLPALLAPDIELSEKTRNLYGTGRPSAGPDGVLYWEGGGRNGGALSCGYVSSSLRSLERGIRPQEASFVSAVIAVRDQPAVSPISELPSSFLYRLSVDDLRLMPAVALGDAPEGLAGLVVLKTEVLSATAYRTQQPGGGYTAVGQIEAGDWDPLVATAPANQDILGLTLEMPLSEFEVAARERIPSAVAFGTAVPGQGMFGHAMAMIDPETDESLTAIYADHVEGKPVMAIKRRIVFDAADYTIEGLKLAFAEKYGPNYREEGDSYLYWGVLPPEADTYGYCGTPWIYTPNHSAMPELDRIAPEDEGEGDQAPIRSDSILRGAGWPDEFDHGRAGVIPDITQCAPLVAVQMLQSGRKLFVETWLFDRALAERLDAVPRAATEMTMPDL
jgi:hypothetical protein